MSVLAIRIIGGVLGGTIGTIIGDKIYKYIYVKREQSYTPKQIENKFDNVKSFQELMDIKLNESLNSTDSEENQNEENENKIRDINYDIDVDIEDENESLFVNDAIYDNNYIDYYSLYFGHEKEKEN